LQHTATHGNTLQHTATHGNTRQHKISNCHARHESKHAKRKHASRHIYVDTRLMLKHAKHESKHARRYCESRCIGFDARQLSKHARRNRESIHAAHHSKHVRNVNASQNTFIYVDTTISTEIAPQILISRHLAIKIQIEILVYFEFVPKN